MIRVFLLFSIVISALGLQAQPLQPVSWSFSAGQAEEGVFLLECHATVSEGWYIYSQHLDEGGPIPTSVTFEPSTTYSLLGATTEIGEKIEGMDPIFGMTIAKYKKQVILRQKVRLNAPEGTVRGSVTFMTCNDEQCLPPRSMDFSFVIEQK